MAKSYFDAVMEDNKKLANTAIPEGAMSYADYVTASGVDSAGDLEAAKKSAETGYLAAVESAERAHDRAIGTYGQNAEAMARAGLGGSGYSDYITGNAYAAKQGSIDAAKATRQASIDAAESTKKLTDAGTQRGYLNYIENYKTQKKADSVAAISDIVTMNLSGEGAKSYLEALGLGSESDKILGITEGIRTKQAEEEAKAKADAADANYGSAVEYAAGLINVGFSDDYINKMLSKQYGYDLAQVREVMNMAREYEAKVADNISDDEDSTAVDLTNSGRNLNDMAEMYAIVGLYGQNGTEGANSLKYHAKLHGFDDVEKELALRGNTEGLVKHWTNQLRAKGYTPEQIDKILDMIEEQSKYSTFAWG